MFFQQIASGLASGSLYALIAIGFVIIYKSTDVVNFSQGETAMAGAYFGYLVYSNFPLPYWLVLILALIPGALLGLILERVAFRTLINQPILSIIIATLAVGIILKSLARIIFGPVVYAFPPVFSPEPFSILSVKITVQTIWILAAVTIFMLLLFALFRFTKIGLGMRATCQDKETATMMGVSVRGVFSFSWALSSAIGSFAGVLLAPLISVEPEMGLIAIKAFGAAILGGFQSFPGAVLGGLIIGVVENLSGGYIGSTMKDIVTFLVIIMALIFFPSGLLGKGAAKKV
jgi:branched-chain amino acid transport system permease protein